MNTNNRTPARRWAHKILFSGQELGPSSMQVKGATPSRSLGGIALPPAGVTRRSLSAPGTQRPDRHSRGRASGSEREDEGEHRKRADHENLGLRRTARTAATSWTCVLIRSRRLNGLWMQLGRCRTLAATRVRRLPIYRPKAPFICGCERMGRRVRRLCRRPVAPCAVAKARTKARRARLPHIVCLVSVFPSCSAYGGRRGCWPGRRACCTRRSASGSGPTGNCSGLLPPRLDLPWARSSS